MISFGAEAPKLLFAGPTLAGLRDVCAVTDAGFTVRPPAQRGDILTVIPTGPGIIVLVDGFFHQSLAVGHAELRKAIEAGWRVWGLSSMGAIRAYEMQRLGMQGFGRIFEHFLGDRDFQDDEVAQLHSPAPYYFSLTEPLIHLRYFVREMEQSGVVRGTDAVAIVRELKARWYGHRSLELLVTLIDRISGAQAAAIALQWAGDLDRFRIKAQDLATFVERSVWLLDRWRPIPTIAPYCPTTR